MRKIHRYAAPHPVAEIEQGSADVASRPLSEIEQESATVASHPMAEIEHASEAVASHPMAEIEQEWADVASHPMAEIEQASEAVASQPMSEIEQASEAVASHPMAQIEQDSAAATSHPMSEIEQESAAREDILSFKPMPLADLEKMIYPLRQLLSTEVVGLDRVPTDYPSLFVMNHALWGIEAPSFVHLLYKEKGFFVRGLGDHFHFHWAALVKIIMGIRSVWDCID